MLKGLGLAVVVWGSLAQGSFLDVEPVAAQAMVAQAPSFQPGFWQPVARVDPHRPITVELLNRSGDVLEYGLTDPTYVVAELPVDVGVRFALTEIPTFVTMNHLFRSALRYTVATTEDNVIQVLVERVDDVAGDRTLNIDEFGAIYVY